MQNITAEFVNISGIPTAFTVHGTGRDVLMLHGWGADMSLVLPLAERLAARGYRVWALDLPGMGQTAAPDEPWKVVDYVMFVLRFMDYMEIERCALFGHSFGGRLGLILGSDHPERIERMVLSNSAGVRAKTSLLRQMRLSSYKLVRDGLRRMGAKGTAERLRQAYNARYGSADFNATSGVMRQTFINVIQEDLLPYAVRVSVPTLLIWGDQDEDTPLWQGRLLEKTIPDAGLVLYEGAGHYTYLDRLNDVAQVIDYFLKNDSE